MRIYVVVMRMTQTDDDAEVFLTKRQAKNFVKTKLQAYINAAHMEASKYGDVKPSVERADDVQSYKGSKGMSYSVGFALSSGNYVYSARIVEKEL